MATFRNITCESSAGVGTATWPTTTLILPCTLEVTGEYCNLTPSINANIAPAGALALTSGTPGTMDNVAIGGTTPLAGRFTTLVPTTPLAAAGKLPTVVAYKTADTTRSSTTTFAADPDLTFSVPSAGVYYIEIQLICFSTTNSGMKIEWTSPTVTQARWTGDWNIIGVTNTQVTGSAMTANGTWIDRKSATETWNVWLRGIVTFSASGTFSINWAQNTSHSDLAYMRDGSYITAARLS